MLRFSLLILLFSNAVNAQSGYFTPYPMVAPVAVITDTMGVLDETVEDPRSRLSIYRKNTQIWLVTEQTPGLVQGWKLNESGNIMKVEYHDFNGGSDELVLTWQNMSGHSGMNGGVAEQYRELVVYDLEHSTILLHLDLMTYVETWWIRYLEEPDSSELGDVSPTYIGQEFYCDEYSIDIQDSLITTIPVYDQKCNEIEPEEEGQERQFVWRGNAFFLKE